MTAEQFIHWLEGYINGLDNRTDGVYIPEHIKQAIFNKIEDTRKREPVIPATWPNSKSVPSNPHMYVVNSTADITTFNTDTLTVDKKQLKIPFPNTTYTPDINKF